MPVVLVVKHHVLLVFGHLVPPAAAAARVALQRQEAALAQLGEGFRDGLAPRVPAAAVSAAAGHGIG